jgi:ribosomal protein L11 methyltransferase
MFKTLLRAADPLLIEELLWTLDGVQTVEHSVIHPGQLTVYGTRPLAEAELAVLPSVSLIAPPVAVQDEDWAESWKQHWHITPITPTLTVCPSWLTHTPHPHETVLKLDPGGAFGTGTHDTTFLMLEALDTLRHTHNHNGLDQYSVLDVGTGSGILAITAGLFGATQVLGQDIDPKALPIAQANATLNHQGHIHWSATPLPELCHTRYSLVLANILAPVIIELLPDLALRLEKPQGTLLTSGIIDTAAPGVIEAAAAQGLTLTHRANRHPWCMLQFAWA